MLPSNGNDPAGNGVESRNHKVTGLVSMVPQTTVSGLTFDDRHAAFVAGYDLGKSERVEAEIEDRVSARLYQLSREALGMARRHAADTGPAWASLIAWAGSSDD